MFLPHSSVRCAVKRAYSVPISPTTRWIPSANYSDRLWLNAVNSRYKLQPNMEPTALAWARSNCYTNTESRQNCTNRWDSGCLSQSHCVTCNCPPENSLMYSISCDHSVVMPTRCQLDIHYHSLPLTHIPTTTHYRYHSIPSLSST